MRHPQFRWLVLISYVLTGVLSQLIWITFASILSLTAQTYNVPEAAVGYLSLVFPLVYIIISIPVGYFIDAYGFRKAVLLGTGFMAVFGLLRAFSPNFNFLLIFQALAAVGQPFIMNSISKLVKCWFPEKEAVIATGLGSLSLFIGMIMGLVLTPLLAELFQLQYALLLYGVFSMMVFACFYFLGKEPSAKHSEKELVRFSEFIKVGKNKNILLLSVLFFICIGIFTAFLTWIEPLLEFQNVSQEFAGLLGGIMIIGGILGSLIIPGFASKYETIKKPLTISLLLSAVLLFIFTALNETVLFGLVLFSFGFFFMSLLPLGLELSAESVEKKYLGTANSLLYEFSQIGGLVMIVLYEFVAEAQSWTSTLVLSAVLILICVLTALLIKAK